MRPGLTIRRMIVSEEHSTNLVRGDGCSTPRANNSIEKEWVSRLRAEATHLALQHIERLRLVLDPRIMNNPSHPGGVSVVIRLPYYCCSTPVCRRGGSKLERSVPPAPVTDARPRGNDRTSGLTFDRERYERHQR